MANTPSCLQNEEKWKSNKSTALLTCPKTSRKGKQKAHLSDYNAKITLSSQTQIPSIEMETRYSKGKKNTRDNIKHI